MEAVSTTKKGRTAGIANKRHAIGASQLAAALRKPEAHTVTDGLGMFLQTNGKRAGSWRLEFKSPVTGKRSKITLGNVWLDAAGDVAGMGLAEAREALHAARALIEAGTDPVAQREQAQSMTVAQAAAQAAIDADNKRRKLQGLPPKDSFADVAMIVHGRKAGAASYRDEFINTLEKHAFPLFGDKHVGAVTSQDVAAMDEALVKAGHYATLAKARRFVKQTIAYALHPKHNGALRTLACPVYEDADLFKNKPKTKSHAAVITVEDVRDLMMAINAPVPHQSTWDLHGGRFPTQTVTRALKLAALTASRKTTLCKSLKAHFDLDGAVWHVPADNMKGGERAHDVYLSRQAVALLREQFAAYPDSPYAFPGQFKAAGSHMGKTAMNDRLDALGFKGKHTPHGFRAMMRTVARRHAGCNPLHLEAALAHKQALDGIEINRQVAAMLDGGMKGVYDRETYDTERADVMQAWADWLDDLVRPKLALVA